MTFFTGPLPHFSKIIGRHMNFKKVASGADE